MLHEGMNIEYKREYIEDIRKTVVAFANSSGGKVLIGVADDGSALGVRDVDTTMFKLTNMVRDSIKPDVTLFTVCYTEVIDNKVIVVLDVQRGTSCPYYLAGKGIRPEGVYIRQGASSVPTTEANILKMIKEGSGDSYEQIRSLNQSLTFDALHREFREANIVIGASQMKTLHIINEDEQYSNLGQLLSDQCSHTIKIAVFEGTTKELFKDRYECTGSLFKQLHECYSFIDRYNRTRAEFRGLKRIDQREYPETAIWEALLNAIVHRDYSYSGSILISIFDDRIEFVTLGGLVRGISMEDIYLGVSILRNKNLANVFYRLKLIEAFGIGIPKIMQNYDSYTVQPKIEVTANAFKITLFNTQQLSSSRILCDSANVYSSDLTEMESDLLKLFVDDKYVSRKEVEESMKISQPTAVKYLNGLLDKKLIVKIGNGKNTRYSLFKDC